jgi:hypothetical protein
MKNYRHNIVTMLLLGTLLTVSTFAVALDDNPNMQELSENSEYTALMEQNRGLSSQADSINRLLTERRLALHNNTDGNLETLRAEIISLEQQAHDISIEQGAVARRIGIIEQNIIMDKILSQQQHVVVGEVLDDSIDESTTTAVANLIDNECFKRDLAAADYAELQKAQREESEMLTYVDEYLKTYNRLVEVADGYAKADRASVATPLYEEYETLSAKLKELDAEMHKMWNHILDTKYFAMSYILEKAHRYDILDRASANYQTMQQTCAERDGQYSSDALMRYAIGRNTLLSYEIEFARDMRLKPAQDSLRQVKERYVQPYYSNKTIMVEYREFMDYAPIKIGRTNFYDDSNPLPELQIFEKGTIYRILLGKFRTKQTMTLFKGVQPMSIYRDSDGMYCYYAGGYANESEARDAQQFLKDKGFKNPELYCWEDGQMQLVTAKAKVQESVASNVRYMVVIKATNLDSNLRQIINREAPGKIVSRSGGNYAVGMFTERGEADSLLTSLSEAYPTLEMTITETEIE